MAAMGGHTAECKQMWHRVMNAGEAEVRELGSDGASQEQLGQAEF